MLNPQLPALPPPTPGEAPTRSVHAALAAPLASLSVRHLYQRIQFDALLRRPAVSKSAHFALHLARVDAAEPFVGAPCWVGAMLPKRWARRAVTRNLLRRQIYAVASAGPAAQRWLGWALLVRLRGPISRQLFPSAASVALRQHVRLELQQLLQGWPRA